MQLRDFPAVSVWFSVKGETKSFFACKGKSFLGCDVGEGGERLEKPL